MHAQWLKTITQFGVRCIASYIVLSCDVGQKVKSLISKPVSESGAVITKVMNTFPTRSCVTSEVPVILCSYLLHMIFQFCCVLATLSPVSAHHILQ